MTPVSKKQQITGVVVSNKMAKTVVVKVDSRKRHPKYKKAYTVSKRFKAHKEEKFLVGDKVVIEACKPISKDKRFKVVSKI
jgi:small subunit ribosomal protein S17